MEIPRDNRELGIFILGFFGSLVIMLAAMFFVAQLPYSKAPSGMVAGTNESLVLGLFIICLMAGLVTVVKWREA